MSTLLTINRARAVRPAGPLTHVSVVHGAEG